MKNSDHCESSSKEIFICHIIEASHRKHGLVVWFRVATGSFRGMHLRQVFNAGTGGLFETLPTSLGIRKESEIIEQLVGRSMGGKLKTISRQRHGVLLIVGFHPSN